MILRIDVDKGKRPLTLETVSRRLQRAGFRLCWLSQAASPSRGGWHIEIGVSPVPRSAVLVTALQAILGSDPAREACNLQRARMVDGKAVPCWWRERWNVLYNASQRQPGVTHG